MTHLRCGGAWLGVALLAAAPTSAASVHAILSGTVTSGLDVTGEFGLGENTPLDGLPVTMVFTYELSAAGRTTDPENRRDEVRGGDLFGHPSPMLSASVTIEGATLTTAGSSHGFAVVLSGSSVSTAWHGAEDRDEGADHRVLGRLGAQATAAPGVLPDSLAAPLAATPVGGTGSFTFVSCLDEPCSTDPNSYLRFVSATVALVSLEIVQPGALPPR